jgi:hypothetical protein
METHVDFYAVFVIVVQVELKLEQTDGYYSEHGSTDFMKILQAISV